MARERGMHGFLGLYKGPAGGLRVTLSGLCCLRQELQGAACLQLLPAKHPSHPVTPADMGHHPQQTQI